MIYGKLWCVVKPSVGIPLFLGAVAVSSFAVHLTLLRHANWLQNYYNGPQGRCGGCCARGRRRCRTRGTGAEEVGLAAGRALVRGPAALLLPTRGTSAPRPTLHPRLPVPLTRTASS
jgi:light-harvesting protein B-800-850 alpha chain